MNNFIKYLAIVFMVFFVGCKASAQQFKTHAVQSGETLYSIARQYKITTVDILKYNKELREDELLKPNTILVIPMPKQEDSAQAIADSIQKAKEEAQQEPYDFTLHRVRKRETLYGISQRYNVTEEDIKRYNRDLYATQLKKGMRIQIPRYRIIETQADSINTDDFEKYVVLPKETRWSIAHKYGITLDSMIALNPDLEKISNHLAIGQVLNLPKIAGSSVDSVQVQLYESYTVPAKKTLYSLGIEYDIKGEQIVRLNPEIVEQGGLKEGMVIRLPKKKDVSGAVNTDNFIFYEVKPKQTSFSLTRNLDISYSELLSLNPDLARGLKAGMILKLPKEKGASLEVKNSLILDKINLLDSINLVNKPKLIFMLPFRLNRINLSDKESAESAISRSNAIKYSLGLYSGALVAVDSIAKLGLSVDIKTYDTELDMQKAKAVMRAENLSDVSAIVGPLQANSLKEVAVQAANYQVPVIAPLTSDSDISLNNVFFSIPTDDILRERMLNYMETQVEDQNLIIIADTVNAFAAQKITEKFPGSKIVEVVEEEENISINLEDFLLLLSEEKENWVFVESNNTEWVSSIISILNSSNTEEIKVRMFTTNKNRAFESDVISSTHLSNLRFTYPSAYREVGRDSFVRQYRRKWGSTPDRYAVRGFDLTYDLLLKLAYKANLFEASDLVGVTEYTGNKFNYNQDFSAGYYNTACYIMKYEEMHIIEVKP
ncbi:LysM peptidoglycan-binding domain-containing protein [Muriicola sp. Z0-33]|uniref:PBP1 and LysM peptidoglycan-binding domain-containing protein n=1 Tax=Muriicola sp. Z0-33 TaxID=2816957 RepID=UPI0022375BB6|nr:LysM peptidoglycan-binding domain-containing protein [Muriicola sp. Z0-33]MCW5517273.1 LysM peptidoglycan-binding domain-containing protein [Muriicola sp. Z0-33]